MEWEDGTGAAAGPSARRSHIMKKTPLRKLTLHRESLLHLETESLGPVQGGLSHTCSVDGHSCHYGCPGYTLFGTCTC